jgi:hypothetical protein
MKQFFQQLIGRGTPRVPRTGHRLLLVLVLGSLLAAVPNTAAAEDKGAQTQDLIRSAMIFNFCKFVQWPENTHGDSIVLGVVGSNDQAPDFSSIRGKSVGDVPLAVRVVRTSDDLRDCQIIYIADGQENWVRETLSVAAAESILTISDQDGFCNEGGIIQLVERRGKLRFFINRQAADKAHLELSSQLLKVAKIVEGG